MPQIPAFPFIKENPSQKHKPFFFTVLFLGAVLEIHNLDLECVNDCDVKKYRSGTYIAVRCDLFEGRNN